VEVTGAGVETVVEDGAGVETVIEDGTTGAAGAGVETVVEDGTTGAAGATVVEDVAGVFVGAVTEVSDGLAVAVVVVGTLSNPSLLT